MVTARSKKPLPTAVLQAGLLLVAVVLAVGALRTMYFATVADLSTAKARMAVQQWRSTPRQVALKEWAGWRADLAQGLALTPDDSLLHDQLAYLYAAYAQQSKATPDLARDFYLQAYASFSRAAVLRPMQPELAQNAGLAADLSGQPDLKAPGLVWSCRSISYTAKGVILGSYLKSLPPGACG